MSRLTQIQREAELADSFLQRVSAGEDPDAVLKSLEEESTPDPVTPSESDPSQQDPALTEPQVTEPEPQAPPVAAAPVVAPPSDAPGDQERYKQEVKEMNEFQRKAAEARKAREKAESVFQAEDKETQRLIAELEERKRRRQEVEAALQNTPDPDEEEIRALTEEYPDVAKLIKAMARKQARSEVEPLRKDFATVREELESAKAFQQDLQYKDTVRSTLVDIVAVHPDAIAVTNSPEFAAWMDEQPSFMQDAMRNYAQRPPADTVAILNQYKKAATPEPATAPPARKPSAVTMDSGVRSNPAVSPNLTSNTTADIYTEAEMQKIEFVMAKARNQAEREAINAKINRTMQAARSK